MFESEWKPPEIYKIESESDLLELSHNRNISSVIDPILYIKKDLFEMHHPGDINNKFIEGQFYQDICDQGTAYGRWIYYPWNSSVVRLPESNDYYDLRTFRNRNLITKDEQAILRNKKIAAFGLSVGSNIVDNLTLSGIGIEYLLFDPDRLSPTNLNRIRLAGCTGLGLLKTTITGRRIAELDPYLAQQHFSNGYDSETDEILQRERPDAIIEEVDNLEVKSKLRKIAKELAVPLIMIGDAGDKVILDVERHDLGQVSNFNGKLSKNDIELLTSGQASKRDQESIFMKLIGINNLSPRLIQSSMLRGQELAGFPQLGTTAGIAGAVASVALREIFLGRDIRSGTRSAIDIRKAVRSSAPTTMVENYVILKDLVNYRKK